jgi:opacity protein-like surface antigen
MSFRLSFLLGPCLFAFATTALAEAEAVFLISGGEADIEKDAFGGTDTGFKIGSGFKVTENSGIEIYWAKYGKPKKTVNIPVLGATETSTELYSLAFQYAHFFPLTDSVDLLGRFGMAFWKSEVGIAGAGKFDDDGIGLAIGIGAQIYLVEDWALRTEWEYSELDNFNVNFISVGFAHYFE